VVPVITKHADARAFLEACGAALRRQPVANQMPLGIAHNILVEPERYGHDLRMYTAAVGGEVIGAVLQTPPWPVQITLTTFEAAAALGRTFAREHAPIAAISGPDAAPEQFAAAYVAEHGGSYALDMALGTFELVRVADLPSVAGRRVLAGPEHAGQLQAWLVAFHAEATAHDPPIRPDAAARAIAGGRAHVWLDGGDRPVAFAFKNREVEGWASVGPVFTPRELRGRGYATALVAALSRHLLEQGRVGCTLYTDLTNPTSNAIYERIGYRRVGSASRFAFT